MYACVWCARQALLQAVQNNVKTVLVTAVKHASAMLPHAAKVMQGETAVQAMTSNAGRHSTQLPLSVAVAEPGFSC